VVHFFAGQLTNLWYRWKRCFSFIFRHIQFDFISIVGCCANFPRPPNFTPF